MKERPILFSGEMVRAILDGRKTQTRRVVKDDETRELLDFVSGADNPDGSNDIGIMYVQNFHSDDEDDKSELYSGLLLHDECPEEGVYQINCPYGQPGHQLWVRESFYYVQSSDSFFYRSDKKQVSEAVDSDLPEKFAYHRTKASTNFQSSMFMPRCASRIQLEITNVRVERLQDISGEDSKGEGVSISECGCEVCGTTSRICPADQSAYTACFQSYGTQSTLTNTLGNLTRGSG